VMPITLSIYMPLSILFPLPVMPIILLELSICDFCLQWTDYLLYSYYYTI
jgi:hypothetical protein